MIKFNYIKTEDKGQLCERQTWQYQAKQFSFYSHPANPMLEVRGEVNPILFRDFFIRFDAAINDGKTPSVINVEE